MASPSVSLAAGEKRGELLVQMTGITKNFPGVRALENVSFDVRKGEVHCLLGENGAGKSTLIKILTGVYAPDAGEIWIRGERVGHLTPRSAQDLGIAAIYQEFDLVPSLTVAENVFLGREPLAASGRVDRVKMNHGTVQLFRRLDTAIDPTARIADVGVGMQQLTAIVKALSRNAEIVIMDEPTTSLNEAEVQRLFAAVRLLREQGIAVVYISHRLQEIFGIGDRATVLRDGKVVGSESLASMSAEDLVAMMVGRKLQERYYKEAIALGGSVFCVQGLATANRAVHDLSFELRQGEILGLAGIRGSGFKELLRSLAGILSSSEGSVQVRGKTVTLRTPRDAIHNGIGYLPEDRKAEGLILSLSVKENIVLPILGQLANRGVTNPSREEQTATHFVQDLDIRTPSVAQLTEFLSGGNQQKVIMAKWLASRSQILLFDEPTQGIDVGAKVEMYRLIARFVREGGSLILVSSEVAELMSICDRIIVIRDGGIAGQFDPKQTSEEEIVHLATSGGNRSYGSSTF